MRSLYEGRADVVEAEALPLKLVIGSGGRLPVAVVLRLVRPRRPKRDSSKRPAAKPWRTVLKESGRGVCAGVTDFAFRAGEAKRLRGLEGAMSPIEVMAHEAPA